MMSIESTINYLRERAKIPGIGYAHNDGGMIVNLVTSGNQTYPEDQAIHEGTVFEAASLSKPLFAYLLMRLVDKGTFNLDEPLHPYLIDDEMSHDPRHRELTGRIVFHHATGFPNWRTGDRLSFQFGPGSQ